MIRRKKTKIVATIGPATESEKMLHALFDAGMNVVRLNFSHGDFDEHQKRVDRARRISQKTKKPLAIMQDLSGPKIRIGDFYQSTVELIEGEIFTLTTEKLIGDEKKVYVNYPTLPKEVKVGGFILLDDGKKKLEILSISKNEVKTKIIVGGTTKGRRGVNLPGANLTISSLTKKDKEDIKFGIKNKVDFVALSFVRKASDVIELRSILTKAKLYAGIISKIETEEAIENIDDIIEVSDGIMIARGDLSIEIPAEKVPMIQKDIIRKCNQLGKPVITATQMLESMIQSPVPTRAEVSDVANAILDGTDAVMLSEETTLGKYPLEAVQMMTKVAMQIEADYPEREILHVAKAGEVDPVDSITSSIVRSSRDINAKLIFALTDGGFTPRMISRHKPQALVIALTPFSETYSKLALSYGCTPVITKNFLSMRETLKFIRGYCLKNNLAEQGEKIILATGVPFHNKKIRTNTLLIDII